MRSEIMTNHENNNDNNYLTIEKMVDQLGFIPQHVGIKGLIEMYAEDMRLSVGDVMRQLYGQEKTGS